MPPGVNAENEWRWITAGYILGALFSNQILQRYFNHYQDLFDIIDNKWYLIDGAKMVPFMWIIREGGLELFAWIPAAMILLASAHYLYHRYDTMSIYLMRRLPSRWELHRRCWSLPIAASVGSVLVALALVAVYYLIYILVTPAQCLP